MMYKVLIVEDELFMREGLKNLIDWTEAGFEIIGEACDGEEALEFVKQNEVDLLITDIKIPVMNGLELIEAIKKENLPNKPEVIIISGYADFEYAKTAILHGVVNYILKPIEEEELIETLQKVKTRLQKRKASMEERETAKLKFNFEKILLQKKIDISKGIYLGILYFHDINKWLNNYLDEKIDSFINKINNHLNGLEAKGLVNILSEIGGKYYVVFKNKEDVKKIFDSLKKSLDFANELICGASSLFDRVELFEKAMDEAIYSLNFGLFYEQFEVVFYDNTLPISKELLYTKDYDNKLIEAIENGSDKNSLIAVLEMMKEDIKANKFPLELVKVYINYILIRLSSYFSKIGLNIESEIEAFSKLQSTLTNIDEVYEALKKTCTDINEKFKQNQDSLSKNMLLEQLDRFIRKNYNKNITLKTVAQKYYLNPVYLGQLFKKHYGMYFNSYLQKIRIEEAKKLLKSTDMKIYEISQAVGYNDTDYFIQCFTKFCNMTPNQYRKRMKGME